MNRRFSLMTLKLKHTFPIGRTLLLAVIILALLCAVIEGGARLLIAPGTRVMAVGSTNEFVDAKLGGLLRVVEQRGPVDCVLLGSSVVFYGLRPDVIEQVYLDQTGQAITCYNLGIPAMTATGAEPLAEAVIEAFHPRLLIYGFTLRALAQGVAQSGEVYDQIVQTPWIRYQRGQWNGEGWLVEHSVALRYYLAYRCWMCSDYVLRQDPFVTVQENSGYAPYRGGGTLDPAAITLPTYFNPYRPDPDALEALAGLVALDSSATQVLLLEMPLPHAYVERFDIGLAGYLAEIDAIAAQAAAQDVALWSLTPLDLIPLDSWAEDGQHVNPAGALLLSEWLGAALAESAAEGTIALPVSPAAS